MQIIIAEETHAAWSKLVKTCNNGICNELQCIKATANYNLFTSTIRCVLVPAHYAKWHDWAFNPKIVHIHINRSFKIIVLLLLSIANIISNPKSIMTPQGDMHGKSLWQPQLSKSIDTVLGFSHFPWTMCYNNRSLAREMIGLLSGAWVTPPWQEWPLCHCSLYTSPRTPLILEWPPPPV